jgi:hypothetical protein
MDDQTFVLAAQSSAGISHLLFITESKKSKDEAGA